MPQLEKANIATSLRHEGNVVAMGVPNAVTILPGCAEGPSNILAQEASPSDKGKGKMPAKQGDEQAEPIDNESDYVLDPEEHEMIDSGTTQTEVRVQGGSRTITILVNHDLLKNSEDVI